MARVLDNRKTHRAAAGLAVALLLGTGMGARGAAARSVAGTGLTHTLDADRGYYAMTNGRLEKWDFHRDGTFLHQEPAIGLGAAAAGSQSGTYSIQGDRLLLKVNRSAPAAFARASANTFVSGPGVGSPQTRQLRIELLGADGAEGIVLNGVTFNIRHGW